MVPTNSCAASEIHEAASFAVKGGAETIRDFLEVANIEMAASVYTGMTGEAVALPTETTRAVEPPECRIARLFDTHHQRLYRLARRMAATAEDARDVVQETFLRAARSPGSVPDGAQPEEAWLVRVLVNVCRATDGGSVRPAPASALRRRCGRSLRAIRNDC